jgi:BirA family biotin operon repressor/biotin-[acetyl-CoA-carboxylase] ligase
LDKIPARTVFLGHNLVYVPQCHSTNTLASKLGQSAETPEGTVVITNHQTAGRGQRGNTWESEPGKNLTFSILFRPTFLAAKDQFDLNQAVTLGITKYVQSLVPQQAMIKWPNDVLIAGRKIAGILIENHLSAENINYSIVGIGLNMNQSSFAYPRAASLGMVTGRHFDLENELEDLLVHIEDSYCELRDGNVSLLETTYLNRLFGKGEVKKFSDGKTKFDGVIQGVNEHGQLRIRVGTQERIFGVKEVTFLD